MIPRSLRTVVKLIDEGKLMSKYDVMIFANCEKRTAQRIFTHLHVEGIVRICGWKNMGSGPSTPIYKKADGRKDTPRPAPKKPADKKAAQRRNPEVRAREAAAKRLMRANEKQANNPAKLGIWGL